eukprot:UN26888
MKNNTTLVVYFSEFSDLICGLCKSSVFNCKIDEATTKAIYMNERFVGKISFDGM